MMRRVDSLFVIACVFLSLIPALASEPLRMSLDASLGQFFSKDAALASRWDACRRDGWRSASLRTALVDSSRDPSARANVALAVGRELVRANLVEEAAALLEPLKPGDVADVAALHFYRAGCRFRMGKREPALADLDALAALPAIPERFRVVGEQLRASLKSLEPASLPGIAHDMREIERRLRLGRPDQRTRDMQKDVVTRLDAMIKNMENRQKQPEQSTTPSSPSEDDRILGGKGSDEVESKKFRDYRAWGDLPAKEREKALQSIGKDFPVRYRDAVEEYFRKLATQPAGDQR
jgi:hypothetical protein